MTSRWPAGVRRARDLVMEYGWNATSYQIVNPGIDHWFSERGDAVVGYVTHRSVRVVAGAPVSAAGRLSDVVDEFERASERAGERVCYFGAEARLESVLGTRGDHAMALLGAQPSWRPSSWVELPRTLSSLRAQLNRAANKGVHISEWPAPEAASSPELHSILDRWLRGRGLPPLHFLIEPDTLTRLDDRRVFVAVRDDTEAGAPGNPIAFAVLSPIPARNGWLVEQFPRTPEAPNGTIELLLHGAVTTIAREGCDYVTLGLAPLAGRDAAGSLPEPLWLRLMLRWVRAHGRRFYNFGGLESFKAKFHPDSWEPVYAIEHSPQFTPRTLYAIAGAFASSPPLRLVAVALRRAITQEVLGRSYALER
jgi:phosphatidylglycerol lysyltransferase